MRSAAAVAEVAATAAAHEFAREISSTSAAAAETAAAASSACSACFQVGRGRRVPRRPFPYAGGSTRAPSSETIVTPDAHLTQELR